MDTTNWKSVESNNAITEEEVKYFNSQENIFKNAQFGTIFVTKKGLKASFITMNENSACLIIEDGSILSHYNLDGTLSCDAVKDYEIIGKETNGKINYV